MGLNLSKVHVWSGHGTYGRYGKSIITQNRFDITRSLRFVEHLIISFWVIPVFPSSPLYDRLVWSSDPTLPRRLSPSREKSKRVERRPLHPVSSQSLSSIRIPTLSTGVSALFLNRYSGQEMTYDVLVLASREFEFEIHLPRPDTDHLSQEVVFRYNMSTTQCRNLFPGYGGEQLSQEIRDRFHRPSS